MPKIFISYRRADSRHVTQTFYLLMRERASQPNDFVRIEVESALKQGKIVVPVLVMDAQMPDFSTLPDSIEGLQWINAATVSELPRMERDCERLAKGIERALNHNHQQIKLQQTSQEKVSVLPDTRQQEVVSVPDENVTSTPKPPQKLTKMKFYLYGVARNRMQQTAKRLNVPMEVVDDFRLADAVVTVKNYYASRPKVIADAEHRGMPIYLLRANTVSLMESFLSDIYGLEVDDENDSFEIAPPSTAPPKFTLPDLYWIDIPAGKVTLQEDYREDSYVKSKQKKTFDIPAFAITKYPVTNKQYAEYVKATGRVPGYWSDSDFNNPMQPIVGVSWHDAIAFCEWLSEKSGLKIILPTEQQWQRAAQGDDGRVYPWGNEWDSSVAITMLMKKGLAKRLRLLLMKVKTKGIVLMVLWICLAMFGNGV